MAFFCMVQLTLSAGAHCWESQEARLLLPPPQGWSEKPGHHCDSNISSNTGACGHSTMPVSQVPKEIQQAELKILSQNHTWKDFVDALTHLCQCHHH